MSLPEARSSSVDVVEVDQVEQVEQDGRDDGEDMSSAMFPYTKVRVAGSTVKGGAKTHYWHRRSTALAQY